MDTVTIASTKTARTRRGRPPVGRTLVLACAIALSCAAPASAITRNDVLARAQRWVDSPVGYSQSKYHAGYRTDCSGYVSMCWKTGTSWSTRSFRNVAHRIKSSELKPGDAMLKRGYHIRLFYGWLDPEHTYYVAYESGNGKVAVCRIHRLRDDLDFGYVPARFDRIKNSPAPSNLLRNGSFNTWARSWSSAPEKPVWWTANEQWDETRTKHAKKTYRTARNSLKLLNPDADPGGRTELSQETSVVAGTSYRAAAWAMTGYAPEGVELRLSYLDESGRSLAETSTTGASAGVGASSFARLGVAGAAPNGAVLARVSVLLAGASSVDASGVVSAGSSAYVDDVSLVRE